MIMSPTIYIAIADDHTLIRKALVDQLNKTDGLQVLIEAAHGNELLDKIANASHQPDVCIMDILMPGMDGYDTTKKLKEKYPAIHVLALTGVHDSQSVLRMLKLGAGGYLIKNAAPHVLEQPIREIYTYGVYYPDEIVARFPGIDKGNLKTHLKKSFSDSDIEFLSLCCSDLTYEQIAAKMYLTKRAIEHKLDKVKAYAGIHTREEAVMYAIYAGFGKFTPPPARFDR
jgi:two-component system invasion response regulator UvrY